VQEFGARGDRASRPSTPGVDGYSGLMNAVSFGTAGLQGWRARVADAVAQPIARRTRFGEDEVRAAVGAAFFILSVVYVVGTIRRLTGQD
jgi:hypothetical protein